MTLHQRIREARNGIGMSVNELARRVGVSSTAAWNWDHANTHPRPEQLAKIATTLGVSTEWLLTGGGEPAHPQSVSKILEDAKIKVATLLHVPLERVRLDLVVSTNDTELPTSP